MTKYELITKTMTVHLWYVAGIIKKIEIKKGRMSHQAHQEMRLWIPYREEDIDAYRAKWKAHFTYTRISAEKTEDNYKAYVGVWFDFYNELNQVKPKFGAIDGKALKEIKKYLESISANQAEALEIWKVIANKKNWNKLDDFYRKSPDLKFINSQLNKIITNVKNSVAKDGGLRAKL